MGTRKLVAENLVQKEAVEESLGDLFACSDKLFPASVQRGPSTILPDGTICDASGGIVTGRDGMPVISNDGLLVLKTSIMQVGGMSISLNDLTIESDGAFHGPNGALIVGDDGLVLTRGDVLMRHDDKPLLTSEGKPILHYDLF